MISFHGKGEGAAATSGTRMISNFFEEVCQCIENLVVHSTVFHVVPQEINEIKERCCCRLSQLHVLLGNLIATS